MILRKPRYRNDLGGRRFGKLIATGYSHAADNGDSVWECLCDCGVTSKKRRRNLLNGGTTSCGCVATESRKRNGRNQSGANNYSWKGGHKNKGSLAWVNKLIDGNRRAAKKHGYAPVEKNAGKICGLWAASNGKCQATGIKFDATFTPALDHCHTTGKARGFICLQANMVLGLVRDNPADLRKLADYLERNDGLNRTSVGDCGLSADFRPCGNDFY